jgi:putative heme iron utilization protein
VTPKSDSAATAVNELLNQSFAASLGTNHPSGTPFVSLVNVARLRPDAMVMLLSGLAQHTRNLRADPRCSLLVASETKPGVDPLTAARVTLSGRAVMLSRDRDDAERACMLSRHPSAAMYAEFGDFSIFRFEFDEAHLVAGFGRIQTISADDLK